MLERAGAEGALGRSAFALEFVDAVPAPSALVAAAARLRPPSAASLAVPELSVHPCAPSVYAGQRSAHLRQLDAPADDMWTAFADAAQAYELRVDGALVGGCSVDEDGRLLRYHLDSSAREHGGALLRRAIEALELSSLMLSSADPGFARAVWELQLVASPHTLLYALDADSAEHAGGHEPLRRARADELERIVDFDERVTGAPRAFLEGYVARWLREGELWLHEREGELLAVGELRPDAHQGGVAHLGVMVAEAARGAGLGAGVLRALAVRARMGGWRPVCSTEVSNGAARKAIERAGFRSEHALYAVPLAPRPAASGELELQGGLPGAEARRAALLALSEAERRASLEPPVELGASRSQLWWVEFAPSIAVVDEAGRPAGRPGAVLRCAVLARVAPGPVVYELSGPSWAELPWDTYHEDLRELLAEDEVPWLALPAARIRGHCAAPRGLERSALNEASSAFLQRLEASHAELARHAAMDEHCPARLLVELPSPTRDPEGALVLYMHAGTEPALSFGPWSARASELGGEGALLEFARSILEDRRALCAPYVEGAEAQLLDLAQPDALLELLTRRGAPERVWVSSWSGRADRVLGRDELDAAP